MQQPVCPPPFAVYFLLAAIALVGLWSLRCLVRPGKDRYRNYPVDYDGADQNLL